ncbi:acyltransferase [Zestomonas carbonaria]|uniref:Acetyltransferase n=1 Tax=Zestomonas carbonaria TaxID=2762745 RepID=A0A7U7ERA0_9GAMM|nr:acyltransferase [Pseudomonas carbonaria]CAD5109713.1 Putative acetyltransferase [Pseudomonas carbonaria]
MVINNLVSFLASRLKGENFRLDPGVTDGYLFRFAFSRGIMYLRGLLYLQRMVMVGSGVQLFAKSHMRFGRSVSIDDGCVVNGLSRDGILFGDNVSIQKRTIIECTGSLRHLGKGLSLGRNVGVGSNSFLGCAGGIDIGDDTIIGNYVSFHSENHNHSDIGMPIRLQGVSHLGIKVGRGCWIGAKVTILDGAVIEDGCIIAAGALLPRGRYVANSIYGGVPAKLIKKR